MARTKPAVADPNAVSAGECAAPFDHFDAAARHGTRKVFRDVLDHILFARDQGGPVQFRLADCNPVLRSPFDVVKRLSGSDQHLLWRAAAFGTGAAAVARFNNGHRYPAARDGAGPADPGIATANVHNAKLLFV